MNYIPVTDAERAMMLETIGVDSAAELFSDVPARVRRRVLNLPSVLSEFEVTTLLRELSERNLDLVHHPSFLGAGAYRHYIPSVVNHATGRSEFYTSYTPYQPEISQGTLQTIYEFQSLVAILTGMEVANASMYDGATAMAEAAIMAANTTNRDKIVVAPSVHPEYRQVMETYVQGLRFHVLTPTEPGATHSGATSISATVDQLDQDTACVIVQYPNFFGVIEDVAGIAAAAHAVGALCVVVVNPIALGLLQSPGALDADIVVGEGQPLGIPASFGGPYLGLFATRDRFIRHMPGRIVGGTTDTKGQRGFVLTFQTREQHIRREKATSNICSNEALCALASTVYLSYLGKTGMRQVAELCLQKAHYAAAQIAAIPGFSLPFTAPFFHEFVVRCPVPPDDVNRHLLADGIIGGFPLGHFYPDLSDCLLFCVTELNTRAEIDALVDSLRRLGDRVTKPEAARIAGGTNLA